MWTERKRPSRPKPTQRISQSQSEAEQSLDKPSVLASSFLSPSPSLPFSNAHRAIRRRPSPRHANGGRRRAQIRRRLPPGTCASGRPRPGPPPPRARRVHRGGLDAAPPPHRAPRRRWRGRRDGAGGGSNREKSVPFFLPSHALPVSFVLSLLIGFLSLTRCVCLQGFLPSPASWTSTRSARSSPTGECWSLACSLWLRSDMPGIAIARHDCEAAGCNTFQYYRNVDLRLA